MKLRRLSFLTLPLLITGMLSGCSTNSKTADVTDNIRKALDQAGFKDVSVSQDRDKGVVTLNGNVPTETEREQVEKLVASVPNVKQVVNELEVKNQKASSTS